MEARLVKQSKYTPSRLRELGVREIGRIGSILFVDTEGPLVLMHVGAMDDRVLDEYGIRQARAMLEWGWSVLSAASDLGISEANLRTQLATRGWRPTSMQDGGPKSGAKARIYAARSRRRGRPSRDAALLAAPTVTS